MYSACKLNKQGVLILVCLITGDIYFDHLVKLVPACFSTMKLLSFPLLLSLTLYKYFEAGTLSLFKFSIILEFLLHEILSTEEKEKP